MSKEPIPDMNHLNPEDILKLYRQESSELTNKQAEEFMAMGIKQQLELLFYMVAHTNKAVQYVHSLVDAAGAQTQDMPELDKGH